MISVLFIAGLFTGHDPTHGNIEISRVGSVQVRRFSNITGRVGSDMEAPKSRGSGGVSQRTRPDPS